MRKTALVIGWLAATIVAAASVPAAHAQMTAYKATLSGKNERPPNTTTGQGTATVNVDPATKELSWRVEYSGLTGAAMAAHIHCGAGPEANGPVAVQIAQPPNLASPITGSAKMSDAQLADLEAGKCYVNIHTVENKGGEIRGQLTH